MMFNIDDAKTTSIMLAKPGIIAPGINNFIKKTNKLPADKRKKIDRIISSNDVVVAPYKQKIHKKHIAVMSSTRK